MTTTVTLGCRERRRNTRRVNGDKRTWSGRGAMLTSVPSKSRNMTTRRLDLYSSGYTIPIPSKRPSHTLESGHRASTRSGLSIRISVKSERRFAAQR